MAIDGGRRIELLTNALDAPAEEVAALYKQRWQIELFFKWIKQNLKIKHFLGTSENAVKIQIYVALIAFLVLRARRRVLQTVQRRLVGQRRTIPTTRLPPAQNRA